MRRIWLALLLLVACGDPISSANNCTELLQATVAAGEELPDGTFTGLTGEARTAAISDRAGRRDGSVAVRRGNQRSARPNSSSVREGRRGAQRDNNLPIGGAPGCSPGARYVNNRKAVQKRVPPIRLAQ